MTNQPAHPWFFKPETFPDRHIGPTAADIQDMLEVVGVVSLDALVRTTIPDDIRFEQPLNLPPPRNEQAVLGELQDLAQQNQIVRSFIGMGYYACHTPPVILRNILENPAWYTPYTPYQAEIAQGRLEALLNFQTLVTDLTQLPLANASLLDEGTAAAEAMAMCLAIGKSSRYAFFASQGCHPQTLAVLHTRANSLGMTLDIGPFDSIDWTHSPYCGILLQYPTTDGSLRDYQDVAQRAHEAGTKVVVATDLLALTLLKPPGEFGADIAVGSSQRFGIPLGFGGPHAAFLSTKEDYKRQYASARLDHGRPRKKLAVFASRTCAVQILLVARPLRICCSRV